LYSGSIEVGSGIAIRIAMDDSSLFEAAGVFNFPVIVRSAFL
jgi:hypothetical protein